MDGFVLFRFRLGFLQIYGMEGGDFIFFFFSSVLYLMSGVTVWRWRGRGSGTGGGGVK